MTALLDEPALDAETFSLDAYLAAFEPRLLLVPDGRRLLTRLDPLLFALTYLRKHITGPDGDITLADLHLDLIEQARSWVVRPSGPKQARDAYVAPRECGKTTWLYLVLPLWAAAHGHVKFAAAFSDSATQAETHLATLKHELETNALLQRDFPNLCTPLRRTRGQTVADNRTLLQTKSGFAFAAKGIDSAILGLKVEERRPDLLILDDVEPDEANYSAGGVTKRLGTIQDAILPLNERARVVIVGTVTMAGSLIHQLVKTVTTDEPESWVAEERVRVHYYPAIVTRADGTERSTWPGKWSIDYLNSIRHTRSYRKNFANDPLGADGGYWVVEDFLYGPVQAVTRTLLSVDPAVTTKRSSDLTGIAVVGHSPSEGRCLVEHAEGVSLTGRPLREHVLQLLERFPHVRLVLVETNQGGDLWREVFADLPVRVQTIHQKASKEVRAARALQHYQAGDVVHARSLPAAEEQMVAFPRGIHDDVVDAVVTGVNSLLTAEPRRRRGTTVSYVQ